jgi:hypothetical protein
VLREFGVANGEGTVRIRRVRRRDGRPARRDENDKNE